MEVTLRRHICGLVHNGVHRLGFHFPEIKHLIRTASNGDAGLLADLGVDVLNPAKYKANAVPHIVPAEDISRRRIVVDILLARRKIVMVAGDEVEPACRKAEIILPLARGVEAHRSLAGRSDCLVVFVCEVEECLCVIEAFFGIFGVGVLEVAVIDRESRRTL